MTLRITDISFQRFRSYERFALDDVGMLTVFAGPNAVGKTNIIEGIQLLTALTSFRNAPIRELVHYGDEAASIAALYTGDGRNLEVKLNLAEHSKRAALNGKAKRAADLKGLMPSVTFTPDDLDLVKGSMSKRRHALDALGSQLHKSYYLVQRDYEKVVRHKNHLLKEAPDPLMLASIDEMVVEVGSQLCCFRAALFERLVEPLERIYGEIAQGREQLHAVYAPSWVSEDDEPAPFTREQARTFLERNLARRREEEIRRGRALVGPQKDAIRLRIDGHDAASFGSQGQQRSIVLAWKLAEAATIEKMLEQSPVLLLDDVMSELDGARREALVTYIARDVQTFITTANLDYFDKDMLAKARVVELSYSH